MSLRLSRRRVIWVLIIIFALGFLLFAPLSTVKTPTSNNLYINGVLAANTTVHLSFGPTTIASASPLHALQSKSIFALPFRSYTINSNPHQLSTSDILSAANVALNGNKVENTKYYANSSWLVATAVSPLPDGGGYNVVMAWQPGKGIWRVVGNTSGDNMNLPSSSGPKVVLSGSGASALSYYMTTDDYAATIGRIVDYVVTQGGPYRVTPVLISNVKPPYRGDSTLTTFNMSIPSLNQYNLKVTVNIPTDSYGEPSFSIDNTPYAVTLRFASPFNLD